jgi:hypothetical protein
MPIHLEGLIDPLGNEFAIDRDNLMALLTTDIDALPFDNQSVSPLYMEMARAQRACEWGGEQLGVRFVRWKAQRAAELRSKREDAGEKKPTVAEVEEFYRCHDEYEEMAMAPKSLKVLADLFFDAKNAFLMKARSQEQQSRLTQGHEQAMRYDNQEARLTDLEQLEKNAETALERSDSALSAARYVASIQEK